MLVDPVLQPSIWARELLLTRVSKGIYTGYELHYRLDDTWKQYDHGDDRLKNFVESIRNGTYIPEYGLCDSIEQFLEKYGKLIESDLSNEYCLGLVEMTKEEHPGMRWHKYGEYVGNQKREGFEHFGDEPHIDIVWRFEVHRRKTINEKGEEAV